MDFIYVLVNGFFILDLKQIKQKKNNINKNKSSKLKPKTLFIEL